MKNNGLFITFEGIDGSGKSTQIQILKDYLIKKGEDVLLTREPGGTSLGESVRSAILNSKGDVSLEAEALLFAACRSQLVDEVILKALGEGKIVLCDRYIDSSIAYQCYGRGLDRTFVEAINKNAMDKAMPDFTIYLQIFPEESNARLDEKGLDRIESAPSSFKQRVYIGYEAIAKSESERVFTVAGNDDKQTIHKKILNELEKRCFD
jgi:dTMP kinase